jgi:hypothetical protein
MSIRSSLSDFAHAESQIQSGQGKATFPDTVPLKIGYVVRTENI